MFLLLATLYTLALEPPRTIPEELYNDYTLGSQIPVEYLYSNDHYPATRPIIFSKPQINAFMKRIEKKEVDHYGSTDHYLYEAIEKYVGHFKGKEVAVIGTVVPWYEAVVLYYGGRATTIEYNKIISQHPQINAMTPSEYDRNPKKFDYVISISSLEHDGLGRYGDPLNPWGDIAAMEKVKSMLKEGGLFFLAIPVGPDKLIWNLHRIYGPLRLKLLLEGWETLGTVGFSHENFQSSDIWGSHQPIFVLRAKKS